MNTLSRKTTAALLKYGMDDCATAYWLNDRHGEGAASIALTGPCQNIRTTRQADAAINAGRECVASGEYVLMVVDRGPAYRPIATLRRA